MNDDAATIDRSPANNPSVALVGCRGWDTVWPLGILYLAVGWQVKSSAGKRVRQAERLLIARDPVSASKELSWLLWFEPDYPKAVLIEARCRFAQKNFAGAIEILSRIPEGSPSHEIANFGIADALASDGQLERLETVLLRHLQLYPQAIQARNELWWLYRDQLRTRETVRLLTERFRIYPDDFSVLPHLLHAELESAGAVSQKVQNVLPQMEEVQRRHPGQASVLLALGICYWRNSQIDQADKFLEEALAVRPDNARTRIVFAEFLLERNQLERAQSVLLRNQQSGGTAMEMKSLTIDDRFWVLRSRYAEKQGTYDKALEFLDRAISISPHNREYFSRKASVLRRLGKKSDAEKSAQYSLHLDKINKELMMLSRKVGTVQTTPADCRKIAEICRELNKPKQADAWMTLLERAQKLNQ